jgi:hypothetical protein
MSPNTTTNKIQNIHNKSLEKFHTISASKLQKQRKLRFMMKME